MRWRRGFMAEVREALEHLGLTACPVCGSVESLTMSHFPVLLVDGGFPYGLPDAGDLPPGEKPDVTFAVRIECTTCGHLMLFNALRFRSGDEKIMVGALADE